VIWKEAAKAVISAAIGGAVVEAAEHVILDGRTNPVAITTPGRERLPGVGQTAPLPAQGTKGSEPWTNPLSKREAETGPETPENPFAAPATEL
jgi:hypothetical protein